MVARAARVGTRSLQRCAISMQRSTLNALLPEELAEICQDGGFPAFRGKQVHHWIHRRGVRSTGEIDNLPRPLIDYLDASYSLCPTMSDIEDLMSEDGTRKWLLRLDDGLTLESVFIPEGDRGTLCVSSQVGCSLSCSFCHTGVRRLCRVVGGAQVHDVRPDAAPVAQCERERDRGASLVGQASPR